MDKIAEFLSSVVIEASKLITDDFLVKAKDDNGDLVTNFDYEVEEFIIDKLKRAYPDYDIISEEYNYSKKMSENFFVIDPIDGTINFANSLDFWGIQVACVTQGQVVASVIYLPKLNELYVACSSGAYLNGQKISVSSSDAEKSLFAIEAKSKQALKYIEKIKIPFPLQRKFYCAAMEFAYVACGKFGGVAFVCDTIWDYLPGCYLVEKAGGTILHDGNIHIAANSENLASLLHQSCKE